MLDSDQVHRQWDTIKQAERSAKRGRDSVLEGIPPVLPALLRAYQMQKRASRVGFDWETWEQVVEKMHEEFDELRMETTRAHHAPEPNAAAPGADAQAAVEREVGGRVIHHGQRRTLSLDQPGGSSPKGKHPLSIALSIHGTAGCSRRTHPSRHDGTGMGRLMERGKRAGTSRDSRTARTSQRPGSCLTQTTTNGTGASGCTRPSSSSGSFSGSGSLFKRSSPNRKTCNRPRGLTHDHHKPRHYSKTPNPRLCRRLQ